MNRLIVFAAALALAGCAGDNFAPKEQPSFYRSMAQPGAQLDLGESLVAGTGEAREQRLLLADVA